MSRPELERLALRMRLGLEIVREFGIAYRGFDAAVARAMRAWVDAEMSGPIGWPESEWFNEWARETGLREVQACVGFKPPDSMAPKRPEAHGGEVMDRTESEAAE